MAISLNLLIWATWNLTWHQVKWALKSFKNPPTLSEANFQISSSIAKSQGELNKYCANEKKINTTVDSHDGWISPRVQGVQTEESEFTIIKLVGKAEIDRIAVDTVHFIGNAPKKVILEGCCITASQVNSIF